MKIRLLIVLTLCLLWSVRAQSAYVDLTQITPDETIHVNNRHPQASDANPGTEDLPLRTIQEGIHASRAFNFQNRSVRLLIHAGIYRETAYLHDDARSTPAPLIIEALEPGEVIISGADIWRDWVEQDEPGRYTHVWEYDWNQEPVSSSWSEINRPVPDTIQRREIIFINGFPLRQVFAVEALAGNTFFVDDVANIITMQLLPEVDIQQLQIEVSTRETLFQINDSQNVVVRGLVIERANTVYDSAAHVFRSENIRLENNTFRWNNASGFGLLRSRDVVSTGNLYHDNGGTGFGAAYVENFLSENEAAYRNNWRGLQGSYIGWSVAGMKHLYMNNAIYRNVQIYDNYAHGMWFDTNNMNITIEDATIVNNLNSGLYLEASIGPFHLNRVLIANNYTAGIRFANVAHVDINQGVVYGNGEKQLFITGENSGRDVYDPQSGGMVRLQPLGYLTLNDSVIVSDETGDDLVHATLSAEPWAHFLNTLVTDNNRWFTLQTVGGFHYQQADWSYDHWRTLTGQDQHSTFTPVSYESVIGESVDTAFLPDMRIAELVLIDSDTDTELMTIENNGVIDLSSLPTRNLNIRADVLPDQVGSVMFNLNGLYFVENIFPYAFAGNTDDNYDGWSLGTGDYYLIVTPYSVSHGRGAVGRGKSVRFHVID